jgi:hypothetical protein
MLIINRFQDGLYYNIEDHYWSLERLKLFIRKDIRKYVGNSVPKQNWSSFNVNTSAFVQLTDETFEEVTRSYTGANGDWLVMM